MGLLMRLPPMLNQAMMMAMCVLLLLWHLDMEGLMWHTAVTTAVAGLVAVAAVGLLVAGLVLMVAGLALMVLMQCTAEAALVGVGLAVMLHSMMAVVENMGCNKSIS